MYGTPRLPQKPLHTQNSKISKTWFLAELDKFKPIWIKKIFWWTRPKMYGRSGGSSIHFWALVGSRPLGPCTLIIFYKGWTKISSTHHPLVLPNFYTLVSLIFFRQDTHPILFPYRYIYSGPYMKAHPLYLEKFEYSPSLIFPKFSVLIISSLIKASLTKKSVSELNFKTEFFSECLKKSIHFFFL